MATDGTLPPASASGGGSSAHPSVDELADLHAGALDDDRARQIMPHVRRCPECMAVLDALTAVQAELRALPAPVMPASVAARLDAALAAERGEDVTVGASPVLPPAAQPAPAARTGADPNATVVVPTHPDAPESEAKVVDLDKERARRQRRARVIGVAAAGIVLVGGGVLIGSQLSETDTGRIQADRPSTSQSAGSSDAAEPTEGPALSRYDQDSLQSGVGDVLALGQLGDAEEAGDPAVAGDMAVPANRLRCLQALPDRPEGVTLAVQQIEYEGEPAYVFVFAIPMDEDTVQVVVVPEECGTEPVEPLDAFTAPR